MSRKRPSEDQGPGAKLPDRMTLAAPLRREVTEFAKRLRRDHGPFDRDLADRLGRLLKSSIAKRKQPGRKTTPEVLMAVELRRRRTPWPQVYEKVFPGYWKMDYLERFWRSHRIRDAVRAQHRRRGRKASPERPPEDDC